MKEIKWTIEYYDDASDDICLIADCNGNRLVEHVKNRWWGTNLKRKKNKIEKMFKILYL